MKRDLTHVFSRFQMLLYSRSPKCDIASNALRIGVSVIELLDSKFLISHTFQCKHYISILRTGNFITCVLGPFHENVYGINIILHFLK